MSDDQLDSSHYGIYGLASCSGSGCASQIGEVIVSGIVILWLVIQLVLGLKARIRPEFSWQEVMLLLIFLCLAFNICFMAWEVVLWYVMGCLMNQIYFTTIVYYFAKKYFEKTIPEAMRRPYILGLLAIYAVFCLGELGTFIYMVNEGKQTCKEIAELVVNAVMISLGILFLILANRNQAHEKLTFENFKVEEKVGSQQKVNSPLNTIWIWVLTNIAGQIAMEVQSGLVYSYYGGQACYPIQTTLETDILGPIFMILAKALPFCSTLLFYRQRRIKVQEGQLNQTQLQLSAQVDVQNRVEFILELTSNGQKRSNFTEGLI